jgi:cbb3-type cytochrome oxidase subunit 1
MMDTDIVLLSSGGYMDRFVRNFIIASIFYLGISSILGIAMLNQTRLLSLKFVHSHLNMLGWVSMMIYGVGYHILPKFAGKMIKYPKLGELQFWTSNTSLIGMLLFYTMNVLNPTPSSALLTTLFGIIQVFSIGLFFYNMLATLLPASPPPQR